MDINIIRYVFIFNSIVVGGIGLLINYMESYLPILLTRTFLYGKCGVKIHQAIVERCEVPKRWFKHFYIFAGPASTITLCIFCKYFYDKNAPEIIFMLLDTLLGTSRKPLVSAESVILALVLMNIHCWKRAYETCYISVFSDQKIHIMHYLLGFIHYFGTLLCIIGESERFVRGSHTTSLSWHNLTTIKLTCAFIFLWLSYMQLKTNFILTRLRKNEHNVVTSYGYKIPVDGLFKYISNPLQFTEILMYVMLSIILWQASTYHYITIWVITNQVVCAILSHRWYHDTFKNYPKERKILIPYIW